MVLEIRMDVAVLGWKAGDEVDGFVWVRSSVRRQMCRIEVQQFRGLGMVGDGVEL